MSSPEQTADTMSHTGKSHTNTKWQQTAAEGWQQPKTQQQGTAGTEAILGIAQARAITVFCLLVPQLIVTSSWCLTVAWGPLPAAPAPLCDGTFQILCILKTFPALSKMLYMYICKPCAASDPLAPESQAVVWVLGTELQPLQEQPVHLITEPFLQNQPSFYSLKVIMFESPAWHSFFFNQMKQNYLPEELLNLHLPSSKQGKRGQWQCALQKDTVNHLQPHLAKAKDREAVVAPPELPTQPKESHPQDLLD